MMEEEQKHQRVANLNQLIAFIYDNIQDDEQIQDQLLVYISDEEFRQKVSNLIRSLSQRRDIIIL